MSERKTSAVNLRMDVQVKELLRLAALREHRTLSNMLERMVLQHCAREGIALKADARSSVRLEASAPPKRTA